MKIKKQYLIIFVTVLFFIFGVFVAFMAFNPSYSDVVITYTKEHTIVGPLLLIFWRVLGILIPAVPAGVVSFAVVPIFGWLATYIYTLLGIVIGTSLSFWLARQFREPLVAKFVPLKRIHQMEDEMSKKKEFMAIVALRLFTVPVMDFSSYVAGLTKISYKKFLAATIIASLPDIAIFYFGERLYKEVFSGKATFAVAALFFLALGYFLYKKYFGKKPQDIKVVSKNGRIRKQVQSDQSQDR